MELQHRLARQMINIAVSKAMEDMSSNAKRSIRNLIDLGLLFSKTENQKSLFSTAQKVIANPKNAYYSLVTRMLIDVNHETIKKVGMSLGYSSLIYGGDKLRNRKATFDYTLPWLLIFDICESSNDLFDQMQRFITEGRELGIYSYIVCLHKHNDISAVCEIAKRFDECLFILSTSSNLITEQTGKSIGSTYNTMASVQITGINFCNDREAFLLLKQNRCLYGFHTGYNDENMGQLTAPEFIRSAISLGNIFGMYIAEDGASDKCKAAVYEFVCEERGINGQPLISLEWLQDIRYISEKFYPVMDT